MHENRGRWRPLYKRYSIPIYIYLTSQCVKDSEHVTVDVVVISGHKMLPAGKVGTDETRQRVLHWRSVCLRLRFSIPGSASGRPHADSQRKGQFRVRNTTQERQRKSIDSRDCNSDSGNIKNYKSIAYNS